MSEDVVGRTNAVPELAAEVKKWRARETKLRYIHQRNTYGMAKRYYCLHCQVQYPCPTIAVLDGEGDEFTDWDGAMVVVEKLLREMTARLKG